MSAEEWSAGSSRSGLVVLDVWNDRAGRAAKRRVHGFRGTVWKGREVRACGHAHRTRRAADECASEWARALNREESAGEP